jgi:hypothetical protein
MQVKVTLTPDTTNRGYIAEIKALAIKSKALSPDVAMDELKLKVFNLFGKPDSINPYTNFSPIE